MTEQELITIVVPGSAWPAVAGELPAHLFPAFVDGQHGRGKTARAKVGAEDARLVRMAVLRAERSLLANRPLGEEGRPTMYAAQACERVALRILADLRAAGEPA